MDRFWSKVNKTETCWLWTGALTKKGYGTFHTGKHAEGTRKTVYAHRFAYELEASIPEGMVLDHSCRNRNCVLFAHLEPVTSQTNTSRGHDVNKWYGLLDDSLPSCRTNS